VPVPSRRFETEVVISSELVLDLSSKANGQEARTNEYVETVEASLHEEARTISRVGNGESCGSIFKSLESSKEERKDNSGDKASNRVSAVTCNNSVVSPRASCTRGKKNNSVKERYFPRVKYFDALWRPNLTYFNSWCKARGKESPEEGEEEHHFRNNEECHTVS
jgi:hypothetical protein